MLTIRQTGPHNVYLTGTRRDFSDVKEIPCYGYHSKDPYNLRSHSNPILPPSAYLIWWLKKSRPVALAPNVQQWYAAEIARRKIARRAANDRSPLPGHPQLRAYQAAGVRFLQECGNVLLADETGLGKTVQVCCAFANLFRNGRTLILCPKPVIINWEMEIYKWVGTDVPILALRNSQTRRDELEAALKGNFKGVVLLNWDAPRTILPRLLKFNWDLIVGDEAHYVKNRKAQRTEAVAQLCRSAQRVVLLTGTPIEKHPGDMWSLLHLLYPNVFTSYWAFYVTFVHYVIEFMGGITEKGAKNTRVLQDLLAPFYIRRERAEELRDVQEPQIISLPVEMTTEQQNLYDWVAEKSTTNIEIPSNGRPPENIPIENAISRLIRLRQISVAPAVLHEALKDTGGKLEALRELAAGAPDERIVVFSTFREGARLAAKAFPQGEAISYLAGDDEQIYQQFSKGEGPQVLCSTPTSLGTGTNLQSARIMVFLDRPWSSTQYKQAVARIVRIGQRGQPLIYHLYHPGGTIDAYLDTLLGSKLKTFDETVVTRAVLDFMGHKEAA